MFQAFLALSQRRTVISSYKKRCKKAADQKGSGFFVGRAPFLQRGGTGENGAGAAAYIMPSIFGNQVDRAGQ
jgi:hypothetical protein